MEKGQESEAMTCQPQGDFTLDDAAHWTLNPDCIVQEKIDGIRCVLHVSPGSIHGVSRSGLPVKLPEWNAPNFAAVLDGELLDGQFHAFDCLSVGDVDLKPLPLRERLAALDSLALPGWCNRVLQWNSISDALGFIRDTAGEGIVLKHLDSPYDPARCGWVRAKRNLTADFYLLSVDEWKQSAEVGELVYGRLQSRGRIFGLNPAEARQAAASIGAQVEVEAMQYTESGKLRQGRFRRFRFDKPAISGHLLNGRNRHSRCVAA